MAKVDKRTKAARSRAKSKKGIGPRQLNTLLKRESGLRGSTRGPSGGEG